MPSNNAERGTLKPDFEIIRSATVEERSPSPLLDCLNNFILAVAFETQKTRSAVVTATCYAMPYAIHVIARRYSSPAATRASTNFLSPSRSFFLILSWYSRGTRDFSATRTPVPLVYHQFTEVF